MQSNRSFMGISCSLKKSATITISVVLAGCASDQAARYYATERYPTKQKAEVELLWDAPTRSYTVIADFQARGATPEYMRREAAKIGADAVIVGTFGGYRDKGDQWAGQDRQASSYSRIVGTAIKYKE